MYKTKATKIIAQVFLIVLVFSLAATAIYADEAAPAPITNAQPGSVVGNDVVVGSKRLSTIVAQALDVGVKIAGGLAAFSIAVAAVQLVFTSGGSKAQQRDASSLIKQIKYSAIALLILILLPNLVSIGRDIGTKYAWRPEPSQWADSYSYGWSGLRQGGASPSLASEAVAISDTEMREMTQ